MFLTSTMVHRATPLLLGVLCAAVTLPAQAQSFSHKDWELACDNTRTCRAVGYQRDSDELALALLLTRQAGKGQAVSAKLMLGSADEGAAVPPALDLSIDGRSQGKLAVDPGSGVGELDAGQTAALLKAVLRSSPITFSGGGRQWQLSTDGATAVLLKMDDLQGRIGTRGALVRQGTAGEDKVLAPLDKPVVRIPPLAAARPGDVQLGARLGPELKPSGDCAELNEYGDEPVRVWRLSASRVLVAKLCWRAAYNEGYGFWLANDRPPYRPTLVTASGSEFDGAGRITASQKGRGIGDCWSSDEWAWNGQEFVHALSSTTGMCKLVGGGGAWDLPTRVADVRDSH